MRSALWLALALCLLPVTPSSVAQGAEEIRFDVPETLLTLDAFVLCGRGVIYLVKQSVVLQGAARGSRGADDGLRESIPVPTHHFFCHTGYNQPDCDARVKRLREILAGMDLAGLGEWTWVLVPSQDWKPILRRTGKDPESPAFTVLEKRQTFLEDALFQTDANLSRTLLLRYRVPLDQILRFAVIHELAHAMCQEVDELKAIALAERLRTSGTVACGG